jgi:hypothetical protein
MGDRIDRNDHGSRVPALAGLVAEHRALVLVLHVGVDQDEVWTLLQQRRPQVMVGEPVAISTRSHPAAWSASSR